MVTKDLVDQLIRSRLNRVLTVAEAALEPKRFQAYRKLVLDEFGKSGLGKDLDRLFGNRPHEER